MTDTFIAFFYRERLLVAVVSMLIVAGGILALRRLNVDAFPDVTPDHVLTAVFGGLFIGLAGGIAFAWRLTQHADES